MYKTLLLTLAALFLATQSYAHHLWVEPQDSSYAVNRGMISERKDAYNPHRVKEIKAYAQNGAEVPVRRDDQPQQAVFRTPQPAALTTVVCVWGQRVNTTRGKKLMTAQKAKQEGLTVLSAFSSTQFSKNLFLPSRLSQTPVGMQFEMVPLSDPLQAKPGDSLSFKLLFEGSPLPDTAVYTAEGKKITTDGHGVARIALESTGDHLLYAKHTRPAEKDSGLDYLKFMTFLKFRVH